MQIRRACATHKHINVFLRTRPDVSRAIARRGRRAGSAGLNCGACSSVGQVRAAPGCSLLLHDVGLWTCSGRVRTRGWRLRGRKSRVVSRARGAVACTLACARCRYPTPRSLPTAVPDGGASHIAHRLERGGRDALAARTRQIHPAGVPADLGPFGANRTTGGAS